MGRFDGQAAKATTTLDGKLRDSILLMREEEKLARDVYQTLSEKYRIPIFSNIASAETRHMGAMKSVLDSYGLKDPVADEARGKFTSPKLAKLYDELVATGSKSLVDAYRVGALIEELDIADLIDGAKLATEHQDVEWVYQNLMRGSRNHLRAFTAQLKANGQSYEAKHLSQEKYDQIAASPWERGRGRRGRR
jgi:hypothetical protein